MENKGRFHSGNGEMCTNIDYTVKITNGSIKAIHTVVVDEKIGSDLDNIKNHDKKILSGKDVSLRLVAFFSCDTGKSRAGLVNIATDYSSIVSEGDMFDIYTVLLIDYDNETVILESDDSRIELIMDNGIQSDVAVINTDNIISDNKVLESNMRKRTMVYEPTVTEKNAQIDPNDYRTWPKYYRGPAIERALQSKSMAKNSEYKMEADINRLPVEYTPTEYEIEYGIDPNDASTWPDGYRGPSIERAMMNSK